MQCHGSESSDGLYGSVRVVVRACGGSAGRAHHLVDLGLLLRHDAHRLRLAKMKCGGRLRCIACTASVRLWAKMLRLLGMLGRVRWGLRAGEARDSFDPDRGRTSLSAFGTFGQEKPPRSARCSPAPVRAHAARRSSIPCMSIRVLCFIFRQTRSSSVRTLSSSRTFVLSAHSHHLLGLPAFSIRHRRYGRTRGGG